MKKYELTSETIKFARHTLHRIKALKDFGSVKAGELGGWVEKEENLSHAGKAWVYGSAKIYGDAMVCDDAKVGGEAKVYGSAWIYGKAWVFEDAVVCGNARVCGSVWIYGDALVYDKAEVRGTAEVYGNARVFGVAKVYGVAKVCWNAKVCNNADYIVFKNFWSSGRYFTWTRSNNKWSVGRFRGTGEELIKKAYADSDNSGREYERVVRYVERILADEQKNKQI